MHIHRAPFGRCPFRPIVDGLPLAQWIKVFEFGIHTLQNGSARCMDTVGMRERLLLAQRENISRLEQRTVRLDFGDTIRECSGFYSLKLWIVTLCSFTWLTVHTVYYLKLILELRRS